MPSEFDSFLSEYRIISYLSALETPQQNEAIEIRN